jgi:hypothetical protein
MVRIKPQPKNDQYYYQKDKYQDIDKLPNKLFCSQNQSVLIFIRIHITSKIITNVRNNRYEEKTLYDLE